MTSESTLQVERSGNWGPICFRGRIFYLLRLVQTVSWPLLASYPVLVDAFISGKSGRGLKPMRHLHVVEVKEAWRCASAVPYFFMVCCIVTLIEYFNFVMQKMDLKLGCAFFDMMGI
jgi:hypothetical protein